MVKGETLQCEEVWREISNYVEGEVESGLRAQLEAHVQGCARCASVLAGTRNVVLLYGDERMMEVPAGFSQRLAARIEQKVEQGYEKQRAGSGAKPERRWPTWSTWMLPVGAVALFVGTLALVNQVTYKNPPRAPMAELGHDIPPDMVVVVSNGSKLFHVPGCEFIHDKASERKITAKQAMQDGYTPCPRCMREYLTTASLTERSVVEEDRADAEGEREEESDRGR
jgi:hypothetical protein